MKVCRGLLVGAYYGFVVVAAILLLVAVQLRSAADSPFDTWRLNYAANLLLAEKHQAALDAPQKELSNYTDWLNFANQCLRFFADDGTLKPGIDPQTLADAKTARITHVAYDTMTASDAKCVARGSAMLTYDKNYYEQKIAEFKAQIDDVKKKITSTADQYLDLTKGHQEYLAFVEMEKNWYSNWFVVVPYDLLVMFLVVLMGALGGIVRIVRSYLDPKLDDPSGRDDLFIPMIGMVVAIGGYVLAKAGLLLLSSAKDETSLSPFMIGLVGIVSGLLAREVIDRITTVGVPMLRGPQPAGPAPVQPVAGTPPS